MKFGATMCSLRKQKKTHVLGERNEKEAGWTTDVKVQCRQVKPLSTSKRAALRWAEMTGLSTPTSHSHQIPDAWGKA